MNTGMKIDGGCHCGSIQYEAEIDPQHVVICHCTDCQTLSGTAFRTVVRAPGPRFRITRGTPKKYVKTAESGNKRVQAFCADCGTPIYSAAMDASVYNIRLGTARQRAQLVPQMQIWTRSALAWLPQLGEVPRKQREP
jgi:hypothetical protein